MGTSTSPASGGISGVTKVSGQHSEEPGREWSSSMAVP